MLALLGIPAIKLGRTSRTSSVVSGNVLSKFSNVSNTPTLHCPYVSTSGIHEIGESRLCVRPVLGFQHIAQPVDRLQAQTRILAGSSEELLPEPVYTDAYRMI